MPDVRTAYLLDAAASGGLGMLLLVLSGVLEDPLGLPPTFSLGIGAFLVVWAVFVAWVGTHPRRALLTEVVALNCVWVVASVVFAFAGWVALTGLGVALVLVQAAVVAVLVELQFLATRRTLTNV